MRPSFFVGVRRDAEPLDVLKDRSEQLAQHRHFGHLEEHVPRMRHHLRADPDQSAEDEFPGLYARANSRSGRYFTLCSLNVF